MEFGLRLEYCYCSKPASYLAYASLAYTLACVGYLLLTRSLGTPFQDSLTPEQLCLKARETKKRARAFYASLLLGTLLLMRWRPLRS